MPKFKQGDLIKGVFNTDILRLVLSIDEKQREYRLYRIKQTQDEDRIVRLSFLYTDGHYQKVE